MAPPPALHAAPPPLPSAAAPPARSLDPVGEVSVDDDSAPEAPIPADSSVDAAGQLIAPGGGSGGLDVAPAQGDSPVGGADPDFQTFHDALAPYGQWVYTAEYGWVWQPGNVAADWRPYSDGEWAWTAYGWTWAGSEPWAWGPYHYGRWASLAGIGWGWVPGYTWGPAWVSWRYGPGYIGWTPLEPGWGYGAGWGRGWGVNYGNWNFCPSGHFYGNGFGGHGSVRGFLLGAGAVAGVWAGTHALTSTMYNGTAYVGPHPGAVAALTGHPVVPVTVRPLGSPSSAWAAGLHGNTFNAVAPQFHAAAQPFAENGRLAQSIPASANLGARPIVAAAARVSQVQTPHGLVNSQAGTSQFHGALPNSPATQSFSQRLAQAGTSNRASAPSAVRPHPDPQGGGFSTYHSPYSSQNAGRSAVQAPASGFSGASGYRSAPTYGGVYRAAPNYGGYHAAPSYGGYHAAPNYGGYHAAPSGVGGGFHSAPGGGGGSHRSYQAPSGGGFHGGGGSHGGGGRR